MSDRYAVVNKSDGFIENIIIWDGISVYDPGEEFDIILESQAVEQGLKRREVITQEDKPV